MKPGRELDSLILKKIIGVTTMPHEPLDANGMCRRCSRPAGPDDCLPDGCLPPPYSTVVAAAWQVPKEMFEDDWAVEISASEVIKMAKESTGGVDVTFSCKCHARGRYSAHADTLPHAICLAALKAIGIKI